LDRRRSDQDFRHVETFLAGHRGGFALPRYVAVAFVLASALAALRGFPGVAALATAVPLGLALAFQGLAVTHFWLRGSKSGILVLSVLYFFLGVLGLR